MRAIQVPTECFKNMQCLFSNHWCKPMLQKMHKCCRNWCLQCVPHCNTVGTVQFVAPMRHTVAWCTNARKMRVWAHNPKGWAFGATFGRRPMLQKMLFRTGLQCKHCTNQCKQCHTAVMCGNMCVTRRVACKSRARDVYT